jgi:hypothetical protein
MQLFNDNYKWFKGNTHTHTTNSDGRLTPDEAIKLYKSKGYDFLCLTDHYRQSETVENNGFLQLSGTELDCMKQHSAYHIVGIGMERPFAVDRTKPVEPQQLIDSIRAAGGRAILAHPAWSLMPTEEILKLKDLSGAEVFNSVSRPPFTGDRADSSVLLDITAAYGMPLPLIAADDSHYYRGDECYAFIYVNTEALTRENILEGIDNGRFYASQGPEFYQIEYKDGEIKVKCSPCKRAIFYSNMVWTPDRVQEGENSEAFSYKINKNEFFIRVELNDNNGKKAWSGYIKTR